MEVGGFSGDGRGPEEVWLLAREDWPKATGVEAAKEPNPDALGGVAASETGSEEVEVSLAGEGLPKAVTLLEEAR